MLRGSGEHIRDLLEEVALVHVLRAYPLMFEVFPQLRQPGGSVVLGSHTTGQKRFTRHKDIQQTADRGSAAPGRPGEIQPINDWRDHG